MLKNVKEFFDKKIAGLKEEEFSDPKQLPMEAKRAACAILLELACIDGEFAQTELKELALNLRAYFDLSKEELYEMIELADKELKASNDIGQFAELINQHFSPRQKEGLLAVVWQVIMADGKLEKKEERFARQIMTRLQLSEDALERARQRVG